MTRQQITEYVDSLAAVLRLWSARPLTRTETLDMLVSVGLELHDAEVVVTQGLASGTFQEEPDGLQAAERTPLQ
jgi:hypothetical protein